MWYIIWGHSRFRAISDSVNDGCISFWNKTSERIFGFVKSEVIGKEISKIIILVALRVYHIKEFKRFRNSGKGAIIVKTVELVAIYKDAKEFPIELSHFAVNIW